MADAVAWLDAHLHPATPVVAAPTLRVWAGLWWATYVEPIMARNTARHYLYLLQQLHALYETPLTDLRPSQLQAAASTLSQRVDPATAQQAAGVWRRCLEAAVDDELIVRNPARRLTLPKSPPRSARRHVTPREAALLRAAIVGHRFEAAYALLLGCGLRIGEVLGLAWKDVDLAGRRAWIGPQFTNGHWRTLPKGRNPHWVRLPDSVIAALIRHRNAQSEGAVYVMQSPFPRRKTKEVQPWSAYVVSCDLHALVAELGLDPMTPHAARHGMATALLDGGTSPAEIAARLGHADPSVTMRRYVHASDEGQGRADTLIDAYLGEDVAESAAC